MGPFDAVPEISQKTFRIVDGVLSQATEFFSGGSVDQGLDPFKWHGIGALRVPEPQPGLAGCDNLDFFDKPEGKIIFDRYGFFTGVINNDGWVVDPLKVMLRLR